MLCTHNTTILCQFGLLSPGYQPISPSILIHFWWELYQTDFFITKSIPLCDPVVHTGTIFLLTSKTLPHKPKMYLQDKPSTLPSEVPSGETEEAASTHLTKVYKSLFHGTEDTGTFDQVLSINWQMNAVLLTQIPCPVTSTFYPEPRLLALCDHTFAEYLFLYLIDAHGKTSLCESHQVPLDYGYSKPSVEMTHMTTQ